MCPILFIALSQWRQIHEIAKLLPVTLTRPPHILADWKQSSGYQCGISMASEGNINRGIQLIIDVIDYKMSKGKYLVGMLSVNSSVRW